MPVKTYSRHKWCGDMCDRCLMARRRELTMGGTINWAYKPENDDRWRSRSGVCRTLVASKGAPGRQ